MVYSSKPIGWWEQTEGQKRLGIEHPEGVIHRTEVRKDEARPAICDSDAFETTRL